MWDKILLNEVALKSDAYLKALDGMKEKKNTLGSSLVLQHLNN